MQEKNFNTEEDCMSLEGFSKVVQMDIQKRFGSNFQVQVEVHEILKNNDVKLKGLIIQDKRNNISPTIYLESYYQDYKEETYTLEQLEQQIMDCYCECKPDGSLNVHTFQDWEVAKHRIVYKLINYGSNQKLLQSVIHKSFLDLAIVPYYLFGIHETTYGTALIHRNHLEIWKVTEEQVFEAAQKNTPELLPYELENMTEVMKEIVLSTEESMIPKECLELEASDMLKIPMYILTNQPKLNGAICMLYPDVLSDFANKMNSDLYILPSSVHEVLLIPEMKDKKDSTDLSEIVKEVNTTQLLPEEILSDHVYKFTRKTRKITMEGTENE